MRKGRALSNGTPLHMLPKRGQQKPLLSQQKLQELVEIECSPEWEARWIASLNRWRRRRVIRVHDGLSWMEYASGCRVQEERRPRACLARFAILVRARVARLRKKSCQQIQAGFNIFACLRLSPMNWANFVKQREIALSLEGRSTLVFGIWFAFRAYLERLQAGLLASLP